MNQAQVNQLERIVTLDAVICDLGGMVTRTPRLHATADKRLLPPRFIGEIVAAMLKDAAH